MQRDHRAALERLAAVPLEPEPNDEVRALEDEQQRTLDRLGTMDGAELDRSYVEQAMLDHEQALKLGDDALEPAANTEQLRDLLHLDEAMMRHHLEMARSLHRELG
jgi:predicted outer membrane protein